MTIEKSPSPSANNANPTQSANRSDSKGKAGANDDGSGGFGAILSAVDSAPAAATETAPAADAGTDATKGKGKPAKDAAAVDPNTLLQQNPQIAAAQAQAAADAATAAAAANAQAAQTAGAAQTATDPATLAQQAVLNAKGLQPASTEPQAASALPTPLPNPAAGAARVRGTPGAADSTVSLDSTASATPATAQSLLQARAKAGKEALQAGLDASAQSGQASSTSTAQAAGSERADAAKFLASLQQAQNPQGNKALETVLAPLVAKGDTQPAERSSQGSQSIKGADPTYSGTALGVSSPDLSLASTQQVNAVPPEMQVAEQVSYWVTHNVQNAEMQLDGLGKDPVAVNISVQGNEAQITFRSDDAATRDMLQNSGTHLKDMLQREGLVLTGVSVGSSGNGSTQGRGEQGARQNVRQIQIAPLQAASQDTAPRLRSGMAGNSGRSVDLFV